MIFNFLKRKEKFTWKILEIDPNTVEQGVVSSVVAGLPILVLLRAGAETRIIETGIEVRKYNRG